MQPRLGSIVVTQGSRDLRAKPRHWSNDFSVSVFLSIRIYAYTSAHMYMHIYIRACAKRN